MRMLPFPLVLALVLVLVLVAPAVGAEPELEAAADGFVAGVVPAPASEVVANAPEGAPLTPERAAELRALKRAWLSTKLEHARVDAHERAVEGTAIIAAGVVVPVTSIGAALGVVSVSERLGGDGAKAGLFAAVGLGTVGLASCVAFPAVLVGGLTRLAEVDELAHQVELREARLAAFDAQRF